MAQKIRTRFAGMAVFAASLSLWDYGWPRALPRPLRSFTEVGREPNMSPDYAGTVIPANIAPLNFRILEDGRAYFVTVRSDRGDPIRIFSKTGQIRIPLRPWHALLDANRGRASSSMSTSRAPIANGDGSGPSANTIAPEDIDGTLVFRFMKPLYSWWKDIGIYQRNLTNYDVSAVLHGRSFGGGCLNCHSFVGNDPETMTICPAERDLRQPHAPGPQRQRRQDRRQVGLHRLASQRPAGGVLAQQGDPVLPRRGNGGPRRGGSGLGPGLLSGRERQGRVPQGTGRQGQARNLSGLVSGRQVPLLSAARRSCGRIATPCRPRTTTRSSTICGVSPTMLATDQWGKAETVLSAARDGPEHPAAEDLARRPVPALLHVPIRVLPRLSAQQRPLPHGSAATHGDSIASSPSTASSPNRGTVGPATAGGSPSAASVKTACSPGPTSATSTRPGRRTSPLSCRRKTRRTTIRCWRRTAFPNWSAGRSR